MLLAISLKLFVKNVQVISEWKLFKSKSNTIFIQCTSSDSIT